MEISKGLTYTFTLIAKRLSNVKSKSLPLWVSLYSGWMEALLLVLVLPAGACMKVLSIMVWNGSEFKTGPLPGWSLYVSWSVVLLDPRFKVMVLHLLHNPPCDLPENKGQDLGWVNRSVKMSTDGWTTFVQWSMHEILHIRSKSSV